MRSHLRLRFPQQNVQPADGYILATIGVTRAKPLNLIVL